jgi:transposase-like protein
MPRRPRRQFTLEQKAAIVRRHLVDKTPVSELCNEYELQPSLFYAWLKQALENLSSALAPKSGNGVEPRERALAAENEKLKARLAKKDGVIAEISAEYVQLKKELGEA